MNFVLSRYEILNGNLFKGLFKITIPLIFLNLINTLYGVVDTYFVGQIGEIQVGAVSMITPITACSTAFTEGLCAAGISLISRKLGEGDINKANDIAATLLKLCMILGIVAGLILGFFGTDILSWLNVPRKMFNDSYAYLSCMAFDFLFLFIVSMYQAIRQAHGDSKSGVILNTIAAVLNCILDPLFIFVFKMGTFGAALATVLSKFVVTPVALYNLKKDDILIDFNLHIDFKLLKNITVVALPTSLAYFLSSFGYVLMSKEIAAYGGVAVAGYGVGSKIVTIYYLFINCWGAGLTTFVGTSLGAGDKQRARNSFKTAMKIVCLMAIIFVPIGFATSHMLVRAFVKNISDEVLNTAISYTYFYIFTSFCMGWFNSLVGVFNGSGNTLITMGLASCRMWFVRIPLIKLLNATTTFGVTNIWLAMCITNLLICIVGTCFYLFYKWDTKKLKF